MLKDSRIFPSVRVADLVQARMFYGNVLGLELIYDKPGQLLYRAGNNSRIYIYEGPASVAEHTIAYFYVDNLDKTIEELMDKGVSFEQYPEMGTDDRGVAVDDEGIKYAWFKDPEGHIFCLSQIK